MFGCKALLANVTLGLTLPRPSHLTATCSAVVLLPKLLERFRIIKCARTAERQLPPCKITPQSYFGEMHTCMPHAYASHLLPTFDVYSRLSMSDAQLVFSNKLTQ
jgi:hypothetical protein